MFLQNDVSEKEQRWGAKTVMGSGHQGHIKWGSRSFILSLNTARKSIWMSPNSILHWLSIHQLRETVSTEHTNLKQKELEAMPSAAHGYGGKYGVQQDRMDKVRGTRMLTAPERGFVMVSAE